MLLTTLCACSGNTPNEQTSAEREAKTPVIAREMAATDDEPETDAVTSATAKPNQVSFNGTLVIPPDRMATVTLTLGGVIKNSTLLPGLYVQKNAVIATLENPEFIELQQVWLESSAQLEYLEAEYKRQQVLSTQQAASQKKFQQSKAEYLSMKIRHEAAAAQLSLLGVSVADLRENGIQPLLKVKAPIGGYISNIDINTGRYINPGEPLCEIIDKNHTLLKLTTYEKDLAGMQTGTPVEFRVNGMRNQVFTATIISIGQRVNEVSRSLDVYARVNETNQQFRPGMYVTARLVNK